MLDVRLLTRVSQFFLVPRNHAPAVFDLLRRYRECVGTDFEDALRLDTSVPLREGPPLCCGYGPTGLLVRALQIRAARVTRTVSTTAVATADPATATATTENEARDDEERFSDGRLPGQVAARRLRLVLLEWPLFIVGKPPAQYCRPNHPSTIIGYFGRRGTAPPEPGAAAVECEAVLRACENGLRVDTAPPGNYSYWI